MQVVILAGGRGTRAYPFTEYLPKPMMPVGGKPILVQIMRLFAAQGHREFIISVGHRKEVILDYFSHKDYGLDITIVDTGEDTDTGGRIFHCRHLLRERFLATYGDGVCDVPIRRLIDFHEAHDGLVTITSVPLQSQYGTVVFDTSGRVIKFEEKPRLTSHWINAGFFVLDKRAFEHWEGGNLEREVYPRLLQKGLLYTYRHDGFFKSMDTHKDQQELEQLLSANGSLVEPTAPQGGSGFRFFHYQDLCEPAAPQAPAAAEPGGSVVDPASSIRRGRD